jgi:hypothetical protein
MEASGGVVYILPSHNKIYDTHALSLVQLRSNRQILMLMRKH